MFTTRRNSRAPRKRPSTLSAVGFALLLLGLVTALFMPGHAAATGGVVVIRIHDEIDLGISRFLTRTLNQARQDGAQAVILDINTPGGRLDAALQMRGALLNSPVRTIAFVNREAFSAGALIAIAAKEIYLTPGAVLGAATPVTGEGQTADAKTISAVRSTFRATAEARNRDPAVAEAMVDPTVAIPQLVNGKQLLTLTTTQARKHGYADGVAGNQAELLRLTGLTGSAVREVQVSLAESVVRFLTRPVVASLLTSIGLLLILADVYSGGFGLAGGAGLGLFALFFWGHSLAGLAGWEGVALVVLGLILIGVEAFVIPGFGIAGLLGIASLAGGLYVSMIGGEIVTAQDASRAATAVLGAVIVTVVGAAVMLRFLPRAATVQGMILNTSVDGHENTGPAPVKARRWHWMEGDRLDAQSRTHATDGTEPVEEPSLVGATGTALSDLRPGGIASIGGRRVDVVTEGDYVMAGEHIEVIADERYRRVVRRARRADQGDT